MRFAIVTHTGQMIVKGVSRKKEPPGKGLAKKDDAIKIKMPRGNETEVQGSLVGSRISNPVYRRKAMGGLDSHVHLRHDIKKEKSYLKQKTQPSGRPG